MTTTPIPTSGTTVAVPSPTPDTAPAAPMVVDAVLVPPSAGTEQPAGTGTASRAGTAPAPLVVPGVPVAVSAVETATMAVSTAAYAGGVPGMAAMAAIAGGTAAVAGLRRVRRRRAARTAAQRAAAGHGTTGRVTGRRSAGLLRRAIAAATGGRGRAARKAARRAAGIGRAVAGRRAAAAALNRRGDVNRRSAAHPAAGKRASRQGGMGRGRGGRWFPGTGRTGTGRSRAGRKWLGGTGRTNRAKTAGPGTRSSGRLGWGTGTGRGGRGALVPIRRTVGIARRAMAKTPSAARAARQTYRAIRRATAKYPKGHGPRVLRTARHVASGLYSAGWFVGVWSAFLVRRAWAKYWAAQERAMYAAAEQAAGRPPLRVVAEVVRHPHTPEYTAATVTAVPAALPSAPVRLALPAAASTPTDPTNIGGSAVFSIAELAAEQHARAARYSPESMAEFARDLEQWPQAIAHLGLAMASFTKKGADSWPVNPAVIDRMAQVYQALSAAATAAQEIPALFRQVHVTDLARHEAPRPGERLWNVNR